MHARAISFCVAPVSSDDWLVYLGDGSGGDMVPREWEFGGLSTELKLEPASEKPAFQFKPY